MSDEKPSNFNCTAAWHLNKYSGTTLAVYDHATQLTHNGTRLYFASATSVADYFGVHASSIRRALRNLVRSGFFVQQGTSQFQTNQYRVLTHASWVNLHPGKCRNKTEKTNPIPSPVATPDAESKTGRNESPQPDHIEPSHEELALNKLQEWKEQKHSPVVDLTSEAKKLTIQLTLLADSQIAFTDAQRTRLGQILKEYTFEEIVSAFKIFLDSNNLEDGYTQRFAAKNFVEQAEDLAGAARFEKRKREEERQLKEKIHERLLQEKARKDEEWRIKEAEEEAENPFSILDSLPEFCSSEENREMPSQEMPKQDGSLP